eukprot:tig00020554_g10887.t1
MAPAFALAPAPYGRNVQAHSVPVTGLSLLSSTAARTRPAARSISTSASKAVFSGRRFFLGAGSDALKPTFTAKLPSLAYAAPTCSASTGEAAAGGDKPAPAAPKKALLEHWEGLRGLCVASVVLCHYMYMFYPASAGFQVVEGALSLLSTTPLRVIQEGQWAVSIFFALSGFFLPRRFFRTGDASALTQSAYNRYFRLALPILASSLVCFAMVKANLLQWIPALYERSKSWWINEIAAHAPASASLLSVVKASMVDVLAKPFDYVLFNAVLWMMNWEFVGSFLALALALVARGVERSWLVYAMSLVACFLPANVTPCRFYIPLIAGVAISDFDARNDKAPEDKKFKLSDVATGVLLLASLYMGSYPRFNVASVKPKDNLPEFASMLGLGPWQPLHCIGSLITRPDKVFIVWHSVAAALVSFAVAFSKPLQEALSWHPLAELGKRAFSIVLLHIPIMFTLSSFLVGRAFASLPYTPAVLLSSAISVAVGGPLCWAWHKYVDQPLAGANRTLLSKIFGSFQK